MNPSETTEALTEWGKITLRRLRESDAETVAAYRSLPEVARYQSWDAGYPLESARALCLDSAIAKLGDPGRWSQFGIVQTSTVTLRGDCGLCVRDPSQAEIGITLSPAAQGQGMAAAAVQALAHAARFKLHIEKVVAHVDVLNFPAIRLFTRCNFQIEAEEDVTFKGAPGREFRFALKVG